MIIMDDLLTKSYLLLFVNSYAGAGARNASNAAYFSMQNEIASHSDLLGVCDYAPVLRDGLLTL